MNTRLLHQTVLKNPFLLKDMDKAAARITRAVDNMEKIAVYGDYDADGVTSTAMLYSYLETRGADVIFYIPQREGEGYGMNMGAVEYLKEQGVSLIVTVDNGISSVQEVARTSLALMWSSPIITARRRYCPMPWRSWTHTDRMTQAPISIFPV